MHGEILALARAIAGGDQREAGLLELLCTVAEQTWTQRLRAEVTIADCGAAFQCAAAFTAVAGLVSGRGGGENVAAFTAGNISLSEQSASERTALSKSLQDQAERMMVPYVAADDFAFCGVRG